MFEQKWKIVLIGVYCISRKFGVEDWKHCSLVAGELALYLLEWSCEMKADPGKSY